MKVHIWRIRGISLYKLMFCLMFHQSIQIKSPRIGYPKRLHTKGLHI